MIKVLKWVYNKGRQYERMRLKKLAVQFMRHAELDRQRFDIEMRMDPGKVGKPSPGKLEAHERQVQIDQKVSEVLMRMIYPDRNKIVEQYGTAPIDEPEL